MEKIDVYGVKMTELENMKFSKYLQSSDVPAPNTLTKEQRFELANNWLKTQH